MTEEIPLYSSKECREEIREIDKRIKQLRRRPSSTSAKGVNVAYAGKMRDLLTERRQWKQRLQRALKHERSGPRSSANGIQGPDFELH